MELIDFILHFDKHLQDFINSYGILVYGLLFLIVFMETGLVVTPFLPGDSLLFAAGALAANEMNHLNVGLIIGLLIIAALCGDNSNYFIGRYLAKKGEGAKLFGIFTIRKDYLDKTHSFYEKHGARTIIIARFVPIVRTFAPFVAGVGSMTYKKYITYFYWFYWVVFQLPTQKKPVDSAHFKKRKKVHKYCTCNQGYFSMWHLIQGFGYTYGLTLG